jgi:hypothetical protein
VVDRSEATAARPLTAGGLPSAPCPHQMQYPGAPVRHALRAAAADVERAGSFKLLCATKGSHAPCAAGRGGALAAGLALASSRASSLGGGALGSTSSSSLSSSLGGSDDGGSGSGAGGTTASVSGSDGDSDDFRSCVGSECGDIADALGLEAEGEVQLAAPAHLACERAAADAADVCSRAAARDADAHAAAGLGKGAGRRRPLKGGAAAAAAAAGQDVRAPSDAAGDSDRVLARLRGWVARRGDARRQGAARGVRDPAVS